LARRHKRRRMYSYMDHHLRAHRRPRSRRRGRFLQELYGPKQPLRSSVPSALLALCFARVLQSIPVELSRYCDTDENWPIEDEFGAFNKMLVDAVRPAVDMRLSNPVRSIDWSGKAVTVEMPRGNLSAKAALVTRPRSLADGRLKFLPLLPDWKRDAIAKLPTAMSRRLPSSSPAPPLSAARVI